MGYEWAPDSEEMILKSITMFCFYSLFSFSFNLWTCVFMKTRQSKTFSVIFVKFRESVKAKCICPSFIFNCVRTNSFGLASVLASSWKAAATWLFSCCSAIVLMHALIQDTGNILHPFLSSSVLANFVMAAYLNAFEFFETFYIVYFHFTFDNLRFLNHAR